MIKTLFLKNNRLFILDQRLLPSKIKYICCRNHKQVARTIKDMAVRGAPAIGVTAAFGMFIACIEKRFRSVQDVRTYLSKASKTLGSTRPTAVNLFWALERMQKTAAGKFHTVNALCSSMKKEAIKVYNEDILINKRIGQNGAKLIKKNSRVLTHCNAGALATAGYGTALGVLRAAHQQKRIRMVFVDETRPYLQGARLTAWELKQDKIPHVLITDNMAGYFMKKGEVDAIIVGADRIARNGDTANKIGTYSLAVLAKYHKIPFYVAAPLSTIDLATPNGSKIKVEERSIQEVIKVNKALIAPTGTRARHPAFDVTPNSLISAIITEKKVYKKRIGDSKKRGQKKGTAPIFPGTNLGKWGLSPFFVPFFKWGLSPFPEGKT